MKDYKKLKAEGKVKIIVVGNGLVYERMHYDPETGNPAPEYTAYDETALLAERTTLDAEIADIDEQISDAKPK